MGEADHDAYASSGTQKAFQTDIPRSSTWFLTPSPPVNTIIRTIFCCAYLRDKLQPPATSCQTGTKDHFYCFIFILFYLFIHSYTIDRKWGRQPQGRRSGLHVGQCSQELKSTTGQRKFHISSSFDMKREVDQTESIFNGQSK